MDFGGDLHSSQDWTNWKGNDGLAGHLSYSYQNPYPSDAAIAAGFQLKNPDATFAIASDMSPGGDAVKSVKITSAANDMQAANSLNHGQRGQNILYGDGHVEWQNNPFCGTQHDNIFTAGGPEIQGPGRATADIASTPVDPMDSILLPTANDIGYKGVPRREPLTAEQADKLRKDMQGTYGADFPGRGHHHAILTVDDKTIKCVTGPVTILFNYEVTGSDDGGLQLNLTAPDTKTSATVSLDGDDLKMDMSGEFALDFPWHREDAKHPAAQP